MMLDLSNQSQRNLPAILTAHAKERPDRVFLMDSGGSYTFADTERSVNSLANGLLEVGIKKGDRVVIMLPAQADYVRLVIAINRIGAIWVPINEEYRGEWLLQSLEDSDPTLIITDHSCVANIAKIQDGLSAKKFVVKGDAGDLGGCVYLFQQLATASEAPPPALSLDYGDTSAILWTSGTTGRPKGVLQSHNVWVNVAQHGSKTFDVQDTDTFYSCMPLYNSGAWCSCVFPALLKGIPVAIDNKFSVSGYWDRIRHYGATLTMMIGVMHIFLLNAPPNDNDLDNTLRGGGFVPMPPGTFSKFSVRFGVNFNAFGFGQSEVMPLTTMVMTPENDTDIHLGSVVDNMEIRLIDEVGDDVPVGQIGEFAVRPKEPNTIFNGYFNNPEATAESYVGDWFRMGDLGRQDENGRYYFVDRKKDCIRYKGRSVSSFQVEAIASRFPGVAQCAAFGIPSAEIESEHEIKVDIVPKPGEVIEPEKVARFINDNAPYFIVPRYIEIVEALPYTPTNKVEKYKLRNKGLTDKTWDRAATDFVLER